MTTLAAAAATFSDRTAMPTAPERLLLRLSTHIIATIDRRIRQRSSEASSAQVLAHDEATGLAAALRSTGVLPR